MAINYSKLYKLPHTLRINGLLKVEHQPRWKTVKHIYKDELAKRTYTMIFSIRGRCGKSGILMDIDFEYLYDLYKKTPNCPCCGKVLDYRARTSTDKRADMPTIDRIMPSEGYTKGNIAVICFRCNRIKYDASSTELRMIADWIDSVRSI